MKIANVIEEGRLGGPQIRIAEVAERLKKRDVETYVFLPENESAAFQKKLRQNGVKYVISPIHKLSRNPLGLLKYIVFFPYEIFWLYRQFIYLDIDLVHCSGGAWQYKGMIAGYLAKNKTVWHLNDTSLRGGFRTIFIVVARVCTDAIIVAAKRVNDYYAEIVQLEKPIYEIQAPVNTTKFSVAHDNGMEPEKNKFTILSVGNINPLKGFQYLIEAAGILLQEGQLIKVVIAGAEFHSQKDYASKLRAQAAKLGEDVVTFLGPIEDVRPLFLKADVYVCSSMKEASPISVWEAMSMETPIVSTDVGDVPRFVKDRVTGRIVAPGDSSGLAEAIRELINNREEATNYGVRAREVAIRELDIDVIAKRHIDCYRSVCQLP